MLTTILVIILILALVGAFPRRGRWGYGPSGILGVILIVVLILALTGRV